MDRTLIKNSSNMFNKSRFANAVWIMFSMTSHVYETRVNSVKVFVRNVEKKKKFVMNVVEEVSSALIQL